MGIKKVQIKGRKKYEEKLLCEGTCADRSGKYGFCAGIRGGGDGRPSGTGENGGAGRAERGKICEGRAGKD